MPRYHNVDSELIRHLSYNKRKKVLTVTFLHGGVYRYAAVPLALWELYQLVINKHNDDPDVSIGSFFARHIRNSYKYTRVK